MWVENHTAIKQLESEKNTSSAKHVDIRYKFICRHVQEGVVQPKCIKTENMLEDILTNPWPEPAIEALRMMFNLKSTQDEVEGTCKKRSVLTSHGIFEAQVQDQLQARRHLIGCFCVILTDGTRMYGRHMTRWQMGLGETGPGAMWWDDTWDGGRRPPCATFNGQKIVLTL